MSTSNHQGQVADVFGQIVVKVLSSPGMRPVVSAVVRNVLREWSGGSRIKKRIASPIQKLLSRGDGYRDKGGDSIPSTTSIAADVGQLITLFAAGVNEDRAMHPDRADAARGNSIRDFLANTDFGEILEMLEGSEKGAFKTMEAFNEHLWNYPTKFGSIAAMLVPVTRISMMVVHEILIPIEKLVGPDLLADIILGLVKDIKGGEIAKLANTVQEIIRRAHTGSLLMGKGDKSVLEEYVVTFMREYLSERDSELARKLPIYFAEIRQATANGVSDALADNPQSLLSRIASMGEVKTADVKAQSRKLKIIEGVEQDGLSAAVTESMTALDTYEIAELINTVCRVINRIHDVNPDMIGQLLSGIADSVRPEEFNRTAQWLVPDLMEAFKPLAGTLIDAANAQRDIQQEV